MHKYIYPLQRLTFPWHWLGSLFRVQKFPAPFFSTCLRDSQPMCRLFSRIYPWIGSIFPKNGQHFNPPASPSPTLEISVNFCLSSAKAALASAISSSVLAETAPDSKSCKSKRKSSTGGGQCRIMVSQPAASAAAGCCCLIAGCLGIARGKGAERERTRSRNPSVSFCVLAGAISPPLLLFNLTFIWEAVASWQAVGSCWNGKQNNGRKTVTVKGPKLSWLAAFVPIFKDCRIL